MMYSGGRRIAAVVDNDLATGGLCVEVATSDVACCLRHPIVA